MLSITPALLSSQSFGASERVRARKGSQASTPNIPSDAHHLNFAPTASAKENALRTVQRIAADKKEAEVLKEAARSESRQSSKFTPALKSRRSSIIDNEKENDKPESKWRDKFKSRSKSEPEKRTIEVVRVLNSEGQPIKGEPKFYGTEEWNRHPTILPPLHRSVDYYATAYDIGDKRRSLEDQQEPYVFNQASVKFRVHRLPASVRNRIYGFCFPTEDRNISLSPWGLTKAVFDSEYFACPWDILDHVWGGLGAFSALRKDLMNYFWANYHFHVTVTQCGGPRLFPLSHVWLMNNLGIVRFLTVEVDFTRFGGDCLKISPEYGYNVEKEWRLLEDIARGLCNRGEGAIVAELNLLCRRYLGYHSHHDPAFIERFGEDPGK